MLESDIEPDNIRSYQFKVPEYLMGTNHKKGVLHVEATLCFRFEPIEHNQLAYCPIHIAFGVFRNLVLEDNYEEKYVNKNKEEAKRTKGKGLNLNSADEIAFAESWSQDYYYKPKLLSNAQKMIFNISKKALNEEKCIFKIAVNSRVHKLLQPYEAARYKKPNPFSLVITISEIPFGGNNTWQLYEQLTALNELEPILSADAFAELD